MIISTYTDLPLIRLPYDVYSLHLYDKNSDVNKSALTIFLKNIRINYTNDVTITMEHDLIKMHVYFFDIICEYIDLREIIKCLNNDSFCDNTFILSDLLTYAIYKKDVSLINCVLKYIGKETFLITNYHIYMMYENNFDFLEFDISFNKQLYDPFLRSPEIKEYLMRHIRTLAFEDVLYFVQKNNVYMVKHFNIHTDVNFCDMLISMAKRYNAHDVLEFLYLHEEPVKNYVSEDFLLEEEIDPESKDITEKLIEEGSFSIIKKMYENVSDLAKLNRRFLISLAVKYGHDNIVEYLIEKGCKIDKYACNYAGFKGSVKMMSLFIDNNVVIDPVTIYFTAYNGKTDILKLYSKNNILIDKHTIDYLIDGGHMDINNLEQLADIVEPLKDHILNYACTKNVDLECIEYLYLKNAKFDPVNMKNIAYKGSSEILGFFMSKGYPIDQHIIGNAATRGHLHILKSLYDISTPVISLTYRQNRRTRFFNKNKKELDFTTVSKGIKYGTFRIVESFIIEKPSGLIDCTIYNQGPPVDEGAIQTSARHGYIDQLRFLISKGAPIDDDAMYDAIIRGYTEIVIELYNYSKSVNDYHIALAKLHNRHEILDFFKDCEIFKKELVNNSTYPIIKEINDSIFYGDLDFIISLNLSKKPLDFDTSQKSLTDFDIDIMDTSVLNGHFHVIKYLTENYRDLYNKSSYIEAAVRIGRFAIFKYLVENKYPICEKAMIQAITKGRLEYIPLLKNAPIPKNYDKLAKDHYLDQKFLNFKP